jgi:GNAT superfamily N-acetyltransferase
VEKGGLTIYIDELYVEDRYRKKGIGGKVMGEIMELARTMGAKTLWAQTETYNKAAQSFFSGQGFRPNPYMNFERPL